MTEQAQFDVPAATQLVAVPVTLRTGQACRISGSGLWLSHPHGNEGWCGIAGNGVSAAANHVIPGAPEGCLIVYLDGTPVSHFDGGNATKSILITGPGSLGFGCNDNNFTDNQGKVTVTIEL